MNRRQQIILIAGVLFITITIVYIFALQTNKNNFSETGEKEQGFPTYKVLFNLPYTDTDGPFTLNYLYTKNNVDYIKVTDSSPQGRANALHWLRENGVDPTDLDIQFDDFTNPLQEREQ